MFPFTELPHLPVGPLLYLAVAVIVVASSMPIVALVVAAEPILLAIMVTAGDGLSIPALVLATFVGAVIGDLISYALGRFLGPKLMRLELGRRSRKHIAGAGRNVRRRGVLRAMMIQRWVPPGRGFVPAALGATRHSPLRLFASSTAAGALWALIVVVGVEIGGPAVVFALPAIATVLFVIRLGVRVGRRTASARRRRLDDLHQDIVDDAVDRSVVDRIVPHGSMQQQWEGNV